MTLQCALLGGSSTTVAFGYAGSVRSLELVATDNIPIFEATSAHQTISCCAEEAPVAPGVSLLSGVTRTYLPGAARARVFNMMNICVRRTLVVTERKRRN